MIADLSALLRLRAFRVLRSWRLIGASSRVLGTISSVLEKFFNLGTGPVCLDPDGHFQNCEPVLGCFPFLEFLLRRPID